jgi:hypothetical protein
MSNKTNLKITVKKPTKKEIALVLEQGVKVTRLMDDMTQIIKRDLFHRDENNSTMLTKSFDNILENGDEETKTEIKRFVKKQLQTLIKEKPTQEAILLDDHKKMSVTVKKVNKPMIENNDNLYIDTFTVDDLGKFKVVRMNKQNKDLTLEEELLKWMRSQKRNGLFQGTKKDAKDINAYDFDAVYNTVDSIIQNGIDQD